MNNPDSPKEGTVNNDQPNLLDARYERGDVTINLFSRREALVLDSAWSEQVGTYVYTVIEKGFIYPAGCSPVPGAATFPEEFLLPTDQPPFSEPEIAVLALVYSL